MLPLLLGSHMGSEVPNWDFSQLLTPTAANSQGC